MHVPAVIFLAAALLCSLVGRILLMGAAFGVSTPWGLSVLFVPFAPLVFRLKYREMAFPTRHWRMATGPLMLLFFLDGGSVDSFRALNDFNFPKPATAATAPASAAKDASPFHLPVPSKLVASIFGHADEAVATPAPAATPAPKVPTLDERKEANGKEFERLAEWYDTLKHERGYLRKGDNEGVTAYNTEAAKYQAALQLAKKEQTELAKVAAPLPGAVPGKPLAKQ